MPNEALQRPASQNGHGAGLAARAHPLVRARPARRNADRFYTVLFVVAVLVVGAGRLPVADWRCRVALLFPVVVAAGVVLSGRALLVVYGLTLGFLVFWVPRVRARASRAPCSSCCRSCRSWC